MLTGRLRVFQNNTFNDIGNVFTLVHGGFHDFKNLFPLNDFDWIVLFVEELRDQHSAQAVAVIFQAVDFDNPTKRLVRASRGLLP